MADLQNTLSWSHSRRRLFEECKRGYYYKYYGKWNGWNVDAPKERKIAYMLSNITTLDVYVGSALHDEITKIIQTLETGIPYTLDEDELCSQIDAALAESSERMWRESPKKYKNFWEHFYYGTPNTDKVQDAKRKLVGGIKNFLNSEAYDKISRTIDRADFVWVAPENSFEAFEIDGPGDDKIKVFAKPDLSVSVGGKLHTFEWKSGKLSGKEDIQLSCYTMFANHKWNYAPDNVIGHAVGLYPSVDHTARRFLSDDLSSVKEEITTSYSEMKALHQAGLDAELDRFPKNKNTERCSMCQFKKLCDQK